MPKFNIGGLLEGTAYGVLNEILGEFCSDDGYAIPSRYEITLHPLQVREEQTEVQIQTKCLY